MSTHVNPAIYVVIPAYNEGTVVRRTVQSLSNQYHIVVVDDASTDNTFNALCDLDIHFLRHQINMGQGAALQTGMDYAYEQGADIVVHFDADGQHSATDIPRFVEELQRHSVDIVLGSRFLRDEDLQAVPPLRRSLLRVARIINGFLTGMWLSDAHNGFRVMNRRALQAIKLKENRMAHATEICMQIRRQNLKYVESPSHIIYTEYSQEKGQRWQGSFNILVDIFINKYLR